MTLSQVPQIPVSCLGMKQDALWADDSSPLRMGTASFEPGRCQRQNLLCQRQASHTTVLLTSDLAVQFLEQTQDI